MPDFPKLTNPWLIAVWPGMGHVALNAGVYLLAKLGMTAVAEFEGGDLFDVAQVEVKQGVIQPARRPIQLQRPGAPAPTCVASSACPAAAPPTASRWRTSC